MDSTEELEIQEFKALQERLAPLYRQVFPRPLEPRSLVVVPSLTMDADMLAKVTGVEHQIDVLLFFVRKTPGASQAAEKGAPQLLRHAPGRRKR